MLPLSSVAGLVVAAVEAELEDGRLNVVPLVPFRLRQVVQMLPEEHRLLLAGREVPPSAATSVRVRDAQRTAACPHRLINNTRLRVRHLRAALRVPLYPETGSAVLHACEHTVARKAPVLRALVCAVAVDLLHTAARHRLALGDSLFEEAAVRGGRS